MRAVRGASVALLVGSAISLFGFSVRAVAQDRPSGEVALPPARLADVDRAVERGAKWLEARRGKRGDYGPLPRDGALHDFGFPAGLTAFSYYVLLKAGRDPDARPMKAIYRRLKKAHGRPTTTYETAMLLLAIDARYGDDVRREAVPREAASRKPNKKPRQSPYSRSDWAWAVKLARFLEAAQVSGGWRYYTDNSRLRFNRDVSATVMATLALERVVRAGYAVKPHVFLQASTFVCDLQGPPGDTPGARGIPYGPGRTPEAVHVSGGTTAAGLAALFVCRRAAKRRGETVDPRTDDAIRDATAWLATHWAVDRNPKSDHYHYCYLYSLERCGALGAIDRIGEHAWYREGVDYLLANQAASGAWTDDTSCAPQDILGTGFAILFLKRATRAVTRKRS